MLYRLYKGLRFNSYHSLFKEPEVFNSKEVFEHALTTIQRPVVFTATTLTFKDSGVFKKQGTIQK